MKKIIGIDPGLTKTGIGLISVYNNQINFIMSSTIYSKANWDLSDRLSYFYQELTKILEEYQPDIAAIEETFINVNLKLFFKMTSRIFRRAKKIHSKFKDLSFIYFEAPDSFVYR